MFGPRERERKRNYTGGRIGSATIKRISLCWTWSKCERVGGTRMLQQVQKRTLITRNAGKKKGKYKGGAKRGGS